MLKKILPFIIFLCVAFVVCSHPGVVVNNEACKYDGPLILNDLSGTITSPLKSNGPTPTTLACSWLINNTNSDVVIISFEHFDLGEDIVCSKKERDCCSHQWLQLEIPDSFNENYVKKHQTNKPNEDRLLGNVNHAFRSNESHVESDINLMSNATIPYEEVQNSAFSKFIPTRSKKAKKRRIKKNLFSVHHHYKSFKSNNKKLGLLCGKDVPQPIITTATAVIIKFYSDENINADVGFVLHYVITNNATVCSSGEFACGSPHLCIPKSWRCNGQAECPDGVDEDNCLGCAGITEKDRCDGLWHCQKGQDELGCFDCSADEWSCEDNNECYKKFRRCDGTKDCRNGVDEAYCTCARNQSRCSPNSAYCYDPVRERCDGVLVCPGGEDEMDCGHCGHQGGLIGVHMIACSNGEECYSTHQRCDGVSECRDGSDEHNCSPQLCHPKHGSFLCANRHCIRDTWRCDQFDDCGDASDEDDCLRNSVIVAAAMGGLVCSLLLVIAVGCTCRLYALRLGLNNRTQNQRGGRRSTQLAPLTRLEQHLLQREPPPSYSVAVNDPSASLFGGAMCLGSGWRRQRRSRMGGLGSLSSNGQSLVLPVPSTSGNTNEEISHNRVANSNEEKEIDERKVLALGTASRQICEESQTDDDDDVPLLSAMTDDDDDDDDDDNDNDDSDDDLIVADEQLPGIASTSSLEHHTLSGSSHSRGRSNYSLHQGSHSSRGQGSHSNRGKGNHSSRGQDSHNRDQGSHSSRSQGNHCSRGLGNHSSRGQDSHSKDQGSHSKGHGSHSRDQDSHSSRDQYSLSRDQGSHSRNESSHNSKDQDSHSRDEDSYTRGQGSPNRGQDIHSNDQNWDHDTNAKQTSQERILINLDENVDNHSGIPAMSNSAYDSETSDSSSSLSSSMTDVDTHAAVMALTVVSHCTDQIIADAASHTQPITHHAEPTTQHIVPTTQHVLHHEGNT